MCWSAVLLLAVNGFSAAQVVVDGTVDATYSLASTQTNQTGFGDNSSEWNAVYTNVDGTRLNIIVTGNIEANFNKFEVFFDTMAGGENVLSATPDYDFSPDGSFWISSNLVGLTFDAGFEADYHLYMRAGNGIFDVDFVDRDRVCFFELLEKDIFRFWGEASLCFLAEDFLAV